MQHRTEAREAFLRYRQHGDSADLALVFDLVAQQLLLVASHLAGRQQQPEDLLQETFLTAIQRAERYDGSRPLEPWLIGILVNITRSDWRRRARARESSGDEVDEAPAAELQPFHAAVEGEFLAALRAAIDGLPVPQREVMTLNLVHGMTPTEIAHATSRPVGTVKSWIHRSLAAVRRRLPSSMAGAFAAFTRGIDGLAGVRESIVAVAGRGLAEGAVAGAGKATRSVASTWLRWSLLVVVVTVIPLVLLWSPTDEQPVGADRQEQVVDGERAPAADVVAAAGPARTRQDATPAPPPPSPTVAEVRIVGDFVGEPFSWHGRILQPTLPDTMLQPVAFETGSDGRYTFRQVPFGAYVLQDNRGGQTDVQVDAAVVTVRVPFAGGVTVVGRVVDAHGHGVGGATIWSSIMSRLDLRMPVATADARGDFRIPSAPAGRFLSAWAPGWLASCLRQVPVGSEPDGAAGEVTMQLQLDQAADELDVTVVDQQGQPVAGASLQLDGMLGPEPARENDKTRSIRPPWFGRTDDRGQVRCEALPRDRTVDLFVRAPGMAAKAVAVRPGDERAELRVELTKGATCFGVLRRADGQRLPGYARVRSAGATRGANVPAWFWPTCVAGVDGAFTLTGIPAGDVQMMVASDAGEVVRQRRDVQVGETFEWQAILDAGATLTGTVLDADRRPLAGAKVRTVVPGQRPRIATIGDDGAFTVGGLSKKVVDVVVQLGEQADALILHRARQVVVDAPVHVQLPRARQPDAIVRGRLLGDLEYVGLFADDGRGHCLTAIGADGSFGFPAVPAGDYLLIGGDARIRLRQDLRLLPGAVVDVGPVAIDDLVTVTVRCRGATGDGPLTVYSMSPGCGAMLGFARKRPDEPARMQLPAGRYRVLLYGDGVALGERVVAVDAEPVTVEFDVVAGSDVHLSARPAVPCGELHLTWRFERADGWQQTFVSRRPTSHPAAGATGLRVRLAAGDYTVHASTPEGARATAQFSAPRGDSDPVPELVLR